MLLSMFFVSILFIISTLRLVLRLKCISLITVDAAELVAAGAAALDATGSPHIWPFYTSNAHTRCP